MTTPDLSPYPGTPRWVKVLGTIAIVVALLFVILMFTRGAGGGHGRERHLPSADTAPQPSPR